MEEKLEKGPSVSEVKREITERINQAKKEPLSYRDYRNFVEGVVAGGVAGRKLVTSIRDHASRAFIEIPYDLELWRYTYRQAVEILGLPSDDYEMKKKLEEEEAHAAKAQEQGVSSVNINFLFMFLHPRPRTQIVSFIVGVHVKWGEEVAEKERSRAERKIVSAPRTPSEADKRMLERPPEIITLDLPHKNLLPKWPGIIIKKK